MNKLYCAAPWRGLHITTQGDVKPCCSGAHGFGNINSDNLEDILESLEWQILRQQIANDEIPDYCRTCKVQGNSHNERTWHNNKSVLDSDPGLQYHAPAILDVRWSNACNLMCVYCNPYDSSLWAKKQNFPLLTKRKDYYTNIIDYLKNNSQHLKTVSLIGGEPLLIPQCSELLEVLPDSVEVHVITNLSLDLTNNPVYRTLSKRKHVRWSVSFENVGSQFEYVRRGASWDQLVSNIDLLLTLERDLGHGIDIHAVLGVLSLFNFEKIVEFGRAKQIKIICQFLENPSELDLRNFPQAIFETVREKVLAITKQTGPGWLEPTTVEQYFSSSRSEIPGQIENFYRYIKDWDTAEMKFENLWPELDKQLKECYNNYTN